MVCRADVNSHIGCSTLGANSICLKKKYIKKKIYAAKYYGRAPTLPTMQLNQTVLLYIQVCYEEGNRGLLRSLLCNSSLHF